MDLPKRKSPRLKKYDYSTPGYYFVTICTYEKQKNVINYRESPLQLRSIIDKAVGYIKMNASKRIHRDITQEKIWQRSFYDHIIRGKKDYQKIWEYIDTNPARWEYDCFYI